MTGIEAKIGKAIVKAGFTWSDGHLRESCTVVELAKMLAGIIEERKL